MQINEKNKHLIPIVFIFSIALSIFLAIIIIRQIIPKKDFTSVQATVTKIEKRASQNDLQKYSTYLTYTYSYNGTTYTAERQEFTSIGKKIGQAKTIKCLTESPYQLEDVYFLPVLVVGLIVSVVITCAMAAMMLQMHRSTATY